MYSPTCTFYFPKVFAELSILLLTSASWQEHTGTSQLFSHQRRWQSLQRLGIRLCLLLSGSLLVWALTNPSCPLGRKYVIGLLLRVEVHFWQSGSVAAPLPVFLLLQWKSEPLLSLTAITSRNQQHHLPRPCQVSLSILSLAHGADFCTESFLSCAWSKVSWSPGVLLYCYLHILGWNPTLHKNEVDMHHTNVYGVYYSFKDHIRVLVSARGDHLRKH